MKTNQKTTPMACQKNDLELIRLEAESLTNQIYFLEEALAGLAREGRTDGWRARWEQLDAELGRVETEMRSMLAA